ncbi:hypothetical protein [Streptomyces sp. NPDC052701]|uniref:hypothetical protein n=1 Tax=Streptomyces sp. NPDC052701 TaxID=3155533 RepID=UPI003445F76F
MPVTDAELHAGYEAEVERLAGRLLGALDGTGGAFGFSRPPGRAGLAAVRGLGPDPFAAGSSDAPSDDDGIAEVLAEAYRVFSRRGWRRRPDGLA